MNEEQIHRLTDIPDENDFRELKGQRREFYKTVLSITPTNPASDLRKLCEAWRSVLNAKWIWLWLFYPGSDGDNGQWELTQVDAEGDIKPYVPKNLTPTDGSESTIGIGKETVAELSIRLALPVFVSDIDTWSREFEDRVHRVVCAPTLAAMGCKSLLCIPLNSPPSPAITMGPTAKFSQPLVAAVCAHYDTQSIPPFDGRASLDLMGRLSAHFIANSYEAEQHRIISEMNSLAVEFLTRKRKRPQARDRAEYVKRVIELICDRLNIQYVSVFYRHNKRKIVYCIGTNSLYDHKGALLDERQFRRASYSPKEGLTGNVFRTGRPYFGRLGEKAPRPVYKYRETPLAVAEEDLAWVIYPIFEPRTTKHGDDSAPVLGVIRCTGNQATFVKGMKRNIDPVQIQTLDFIARVLAPVLENMDANIEREREISIIKHDIFAPLKMMRDLLNNNTHRLANHAGLPRHFSADLDFCAHSATLLAASLDLAPTELRDINPVPTKMEADIVAALANMLANHARLENSMDIRVASIRTAFPEYVLVDRDLVSRALSNLIINAIKYGEQGTTIEVLARADDRGYYILVKNKGDAIGPEERDKIFEEGYRSTSAIGKKVGLGMGLPIAKAIMEKHGGWLKLIPSPDETVFSMFFPVSVSISIDKR